MFKIGLSREMIRVQAHMPIADDQDAVDYKVLPPHQVQHVRKDSGAHALALRGRRAPLFAGPVVRGGDPLNGEKEGHDQNEPLKYFQKTAVQTLPKRC